MDSLDFLRTMIETVKYDDDYKNKDQLLNILRNSYLKFDQTNVFATKSYQFWEYVSLRVPVPMLNEAKRLKDVFERLAFDIYEETAEFDMKGLNIKPKVINREDNLHSEHDVVFDEIKDTIIQGIRNAKYTIWIAVAWFTDSEIYDELVVKKNEGVNVRIITSNEESNNKIISKLECEFEVVKVPLRGYWGNSRLHDKFCIIDLDYVMHGSFNWSKNANYNDETLATALDKDFARIFTDEFIKLYNEYK
ncbi:phospholipase D-like domain-containing protein [Psychrobacillus psychrodurans]|uniref:phospholipase D-like domain-containing protein n=1 Tax=Psychrobacillus psychrodurans TaxID=126157 RepID=UPI001F4EC461|nr:phospholipase D-like domain-containing protein [Psychrobacillus psychrodurans]MCK1998138.1 phospholipase D-like domain-containing protein [Psychrobacillus psychrodurans]